MGAPRYLIVLFAAVTLLPACALVWLAWLLIEQDHQLARQQQQDQLERRADGAVEEIRHELGAITQQLPRWLANPPDGFDTSGAVVLALADDGVITRRGATLLFVPIRSAAIESDNSRWTRAERLEFEHNLATAARTYAAVAASSSGDTRAEALVRLARVERKEHQFDKAISAYRTIAGEQMPRSPANRRRCAGAGRCARCSQRLGNAMNLRANRRRSPETSRTVDGPSTARRTSSTPASSASGRAYLRIASRPGSSPTQLTV